MGEFLQYQQDGHVVTLTMNRPEQRNALSDEGQFREFIDTCERIARDWSVRCVILTGAGTAFSAGGNVKSMRERASSMFAGGPVAVRDGYRNGIQRIPAAVYELEVPTIAAINGHAIGAGCDLACMCDIRIASETARFAESFVKLGIISGDGGAWLLPRIIGWSKAYEMTFTGDAIDAEEALACGLVSRVVAADRLLDEARALADRIAANPPHALRLNKRLLRESHYMQLDSLLQMAAAFQAMAQNTEDHREALDAFFEKRTPDYKGR